MSKVRFTFVSNRFNRTSIACLLSALEGVADDPGESARVVGSDRLGGVGFETSPERKEIVCFSAMTGNAGDVAGAYRRLRARWGAALTGLCGGPHATAAPLSLLEAGMDYCCAGEGEDVIRTIYRRMRNRQPLEAVEGLFHLEKDVLRGRRAASVVDIERTNALPIKISFPTYIEIGRGCRWACSYCQTPQIHGKLERYRSPRSVEGVVRRYAAFGMKDFRFLLPNALGYMSDEVCVPNCDALEELLARAKGACGGGRIFLGSFPSEIRPDYVTDSALRVLKAYVSNAGLVIGGQSGSGSLLEAVNRGHTVEDIKRACEITLTCGFKTSVDLMLGLPGEEAEDRAATFGLAEDLGRKGIVCNMHFFMPLPGTPLGSAKAVLLSEADRRRLDRFAQRGIVRGKWRRQEETARKWASEGAGKNLFR